MVMSWIFTGLLLISLVFSLLTGNGSALAAAVPQGAEAAIKLSLTMAGSLCLWTGVGKVCEKCGITDFLAKILSPVLHVLFPQTRTDPQLSRVLSGNVCANILGLGNAATPMGIQATQRLRDPSNPRKATDALCRLVVLNTASIQLIPANVAAVRASLGCRTPFDILPAVWLASILSAACGLSAAWLLGRLWKK